MRTVSGVAATVAHAKVRETSELFAPLRGYPNLGHPSYRHRWDRSLSHGNDQDQSAFVPQARDYGGQVRLRHGYGVFNVDLSRQTTYGDGSEVELGPKAAASPLSRKNIGPIEPQKT
jgi:hypothetical protein